MNFDERMIIPVLLLNKLYHFKRIKNMWIFIKEKEKIIIKKVIGIIIWIPIITIVWLTIIFNFKYSNHWDIYINTQENILTVEFMKSMVMM